MDCLEILAISFLFNYALHVLSSSLVILKNTSLPGGFADPSTNKIALLLIYDTLTNKIASLLICDTLYLFCVIFWFY